MVGRQRRVFEHKVIDAVAARNGLCFRAFTADDVFERWVVTFDAVLFVVVPIILLCLSKKGKIKSRKLWKTRNFITTSLPQQDFQKSINSHHKLFHHSQRRQKECLKSWTTAHQHNILPWNLLLDHRCRIPNPPFHFLPLIRPDFRTFSIKLLESLCYDRISFFAMFYFIDFPVAILYKTRHSPRVLKERNFPCWERKCERIRENVAKERESFLLSDLSSQSVGCHKNLFTPQKISSQITNFFETKTNAVRVSRRWGWDRRLEESIDWHVPWCPGPPRTPVRHPSHSDALKSCTLACGMYSANL